MVDLKKSELGFLNFAIDTATRERLETLRQQFHAATISEVARRGLDLGLTRLESEKAVKNG